MRRSVDKDFYVPPVCRETSLQDVPIQRGPDLSAPHRVHRHHGLPLAVEKEPEGTSLPIVPVHATGLNPTLLTVRSPIAKARRAQEPPGSRLKRIAVAARPAFAGAYQLARGEGRFFGDTL